MIELCKKDVLTQKELSDCLTAFLGQSCTERWIRYLIAEGLLEPGEPGPTRAAVWPRNKLCYLALLRVIQNERGMPLGALSAILIAAWLAWGTEETGITLPAVKAALTLFQLWCAGISEDELRAMLKRLPQHGSTLSRVALRGLLAIWLKVGEGIKQSQLTTHLGKGFHLTQQKAQEFQAHLFELAELLQEPSLQNSTEGQPARRCVVGRRQGWQRRHQQQKQSIRWIGDLPDVDWEIVRVGSLLHLCLASPHRWSKDKDDEGMDLAVFWWDTAAVVLLTAMRLHLDPDGAEARLTEEELAQTRRLYKVQMNDSTITRTMLPPEDRSARMILPPVEVRVAITCQERGKTSEEDLVVNIPGVVLPPDPAEG